MVYDIIIPAIPVIGGYLFTYGLYRLNLIRKSLHINIWNLIIGAAFIISAGAGFLLLFMLDFGVALPISPQLLYWHVELGITLALVTVFHFHTYWKSSTIFFRAKRRTRA
jgi:membrane protein implicated in regulation of membrane protease activity